MKKIVHIVGNRPQFVKLAVLHKAIAAQSHLEQVIIHTGQHYGPHMSDLFFKDLSIPSPNICLQIQNTDPDLFIGAATSQLKSLLSTYPNSIVFTYGDTNSTLAAALAASRLSLPIHHFESGVRTGDLSMPEEMNRLITERFSSVHYCCTQKNLNQLSAEGFGKAIPASLLLSGDLMYDAFLHFPEANHLDLPYREYIACTIHRADNIQNPTHLTAILDALNQLHRSIPVVLPLHPHTQLKMQALKKNIDFAIIPPLGYPQMKSFMKGSQWVITDSGGVAREAFFSEKKSLVIMNHPPWTEILEAGAGLKTLPVEEQILNGISQLAHLKPQFSQPIFGDGMAGLRIADHLNQFIHLNKSAWQEKK